MFLRIEIRKLTLLASLALIAAGVQAQTPEKIIENHLKAIGGAKAYQKLQNFKREATVRIESQNVELHGFFYSSRPNAIRQDFEFQGQKIVQACDGKDAWTVNPLTGNPNVTDIPENIRGHMMRLSFFDDLFFDTPKKRGITLAYQGKEEMEGGSFYKLHVTYKDGFSQDRFYAVDSGLLIKIVQQQPTAAGEAEVTTQYADWREIDGVKFPYKVTNSTGQTTEFLKTETNVALAENFFSRPVQD